MFKRFATVQTLLWVALVLALVGSLRHVAWSFGGLEGGDLLAGYIQAIAVDVGLLALALAIQGRKRQKRGTFALWLGVALFTGVSTYANLLHGLRFQSDIGLDSWEWLTALRPVLLAAVLPILVLYLSEILGDDVNYAVKEAEKEAQRRRRKRQRDANTAQAADDLRTLERARLTRTQQAEAAKSALLAFYADNPEATQATAGAAVGRSRQWVSAQLADFEQDGAIIRNGNGVEVAER
jgi:hypothetical protein